MRPQVESPEIVHYLVLLGTVLRLWAHAAVHEQPVARVVRGTALPVVRARNTVRIERLLKLDQAWSRGGGRFARRRAGRGGRDCM